MLAIAALVRIAGVPVVFPAGTERVMSAVQSPVLHERDGELSELAAAIDSALGGRGVVVLVSGPAGIGKTSLLDATAGRAAGAGLRVLRARGGALERDFALGIVRGLFERAAAALGDACHAAAAGNPFLVTQALRGDPGAVATGCRIG
jgi:hypothetical protein